MRKNINIKLVATIFFTSLSSTFAMDDNVQSSTAIKSKSDTQFDQQDEKDKKPQISEGYRLYAVVDESLEAGLAMNAVAHMSVGLGSQIGTEDLKQTPYVSKDGKKFNFISEYPFIILKGNSSKINTLLTSVKEEPEIKYVSFLDTMHLGPTAENQITVTAQKSLSELKVIGITIFGEFKKLKPLLKKFSIYKIKI